MKPSQVAVGVLVLLIVAVLVFVSQPSPSRAVLQLKGDASAARELASPQGSPVDAAVVNTETETGERLSAAVPLPPRPPTDVAKAAKRNAGKERIVIDLAKLCDVANVDRVDISGLSPGEFVEIEKLVCDARETITRLNGQRTSLMDRLCQARAAEGRLELVSDQVRNLDAAGRRDVVERSRPNAPGQLVSYRLENDRRYVCRVNPGDNAELDAITSEIQVTALLAAAGASQIVTAGK